MTLGRAGIVLLASDRSFGEMTNMQAHPVPLSLVQAALFGAVVGAALSLISALSQGSGGGLLDLAGRAAGGAIGFAVMFVVLAAALNWKRARRLR